MSETPARARRGMRVLVVDDDASLVAVVAESLERVGCEVARAFDAVEGFREAQRLKPHVVITDMAMPGFGSGADLLRMLQRSPRFEKTVFVVLTGTEPAKTQQAVPEGPRLRILTKPPDLRLLFRTINSLLGVKP